MREKSPIRLAFEAFPFHEFFEKSWIFVRKPEIVGESLDDSSLSYAGHNFIASLFLVTTVVAFIQHLLPQLFDVDFGELINPIYLSFVLALQAMVFAFVLAIVSSISLLPQKPAFHHLIVHQVIQVYAVLNLLVVIIFWLGMNRILRTGDFQIPSTSLDLWLGGFVSILFLYLSWRLLIKPLWNYTGKYYSKSISFGITATVFIVSFWVNSYAVFGFNDLVVNKSAICKQIYEDKKERGEIASTLDKQCFIGLCIGQKNH